MIQEGKSGGPAFPRQRTPRSEFDSGSNEQNGMTMLAYYAGQALPQVIAQCGLSGTQADDIARMSFEIAAAMVATGRERGA